MTETQSMYLELKKDFTAKAIYDFSLDGIALKSFGIDQATAEELHEMARQELEDEKEYRDTEDTYNSMRGCDV